MANRVNINITARDLTGPELRRLRRSFHHLGQDIDRAVTNRTRQNFDRLRDSLNESRRGLQQLRGNIPEDEFLRLDTAMRRAQRTMQRGFGNVGDRAFRNLVQRLRDIDSEFDRINSSGMIRVRVDNSALRRADARLDAWRRQQDRRNTIRVRVDPDTNSFGARFRRTLTAPFRQTGRVIGGILSDGIGQGIVAGFQNAGPVGIAVFASIIMGAVTVLGAAIGGMLVFAFGAAFVGIAGIIAFQNKKIQDEWGETVQNMKKEWEDAGEAMVPVMLKGMKLLQDMTDDFAPHFKKAMEDAAPHLMIFQQKLAEGIERFGEIAFKPMMDAFNDLLDSLGPELVTFFEDLGDAFAYLAEGVSDNADEVALAIRYVLEIITGLVYILGWLVRRWSEVVHVQQFAAESFSILWDWVERNWDVPLKVTGLDGIRTASGVVSILWSWVNRDWSRSVRFSLPGMSAAQGAVRALWGLVDRKWSRAVRFSIPGVSGAISAVRALWGWVNRDWSRTVTMSFSMPGWSAAKGALKALGFAHGGVVGRAATGGVRGNMTLVGEHGPEFVDLPPGSRVRSNSDSRRLAATSGQSGGGTTLIFKSSGRRVDDLLLEILRESIHDRGGDPVTVLGG